MQLGLSIPTFDEPEALVDLGCAAESNGWEGVFLWHHVVGTPDAPMPIADTWVVLGALATRTSRVRLGTMITGLPRHQPAEVARQTVTIDRLSHGRMTLGVGLGEPPTEYTALGREATPRHLGEQLDEALEVIEGLWSGAPFDHDGPHFPIHGVQFVPTPLQRPHIPIWASAMARNDRTMGRAARCDGVIVGAMTSDGIEVLDPDLVADVAAGPAAPDEIVVAAPAGIDPSMYEHTGATWVVLTGMLDELGRLAGGTPPGRG